MLEGYISVKEASEKWGITQRRIQILCLEGRIEGAARLGREWAIPSEASKPSDRRVRSGNYKNWRKSSNGNKGGESVKMHTLGELKASADEMEVEFEVAPILDINKRDDNRQEQIIDGIASVEARLSFVQEKVAKLNGDIDKLTNHADGIDYATAVISGIITGVLDAVVVGEWNFAEAKKVAYKDINNRVISFAKKQPDYTQYCNYALEGKGGARRKLKDPNRLDSAIDFLEWKFHLPGDGAYMTGKFGIDGNTHRIDDLCHHPTLVGLICCIIVQFTGNTLYVNKFGEDISIPITVNEYGHFVGNNTVTKVFSGVINWFITCAKTIANRKGHLMSDIATSASLPGSFLSMISELASIPCIRNEEFLTQLRASFKNGIGTEKGQVDLGILNSLFSNAQSKLDISTERAVMHEVKRQAMPVVINEVLVRATYFIRRLITELKVSKDIHKIEWANIIPLNNRTIARMLTIATGTFTSVDMADAAVRAASKSIDTVSFASNMLLHVNFVGVGRFTVAISVDAGMGTVRAVKRDMRINLHAEEIRLLEAKVYYKQAGVWLEAEDTGKTIQEAYNRMEEATSVYLRTLQDIKQSLHHIGEYVPEVKKKNPGLIEDITEILEWD